MRKILPHFLHPTFPWPGKPGILKEVRTVWGWSRRSRTKASVDGVTTGISVPSLLLPVFLLLLILLLFLLLSFSVPSLLPTTHTHTHVHMRTYTMLFLSFSLCTYHFPCPEHCLIRTSFWPLLKHYSFSKTFPEHLQAKLDAFFYCVSIARNSHSVILPVCLSASPLRIRIPYGQRLCIVCFFIFSM